MKILSLDSSSVTASVSVTENRKILAEGFVNNGLTHSQTLMPLVQETLEKSGISIKDIDLFAVTHGPGSFTGVRIGISSVKGMADALSVPCVPVSSLEAAAEPFRDSGAYVCAAMDARCSQVYTASFYEGRRLCDDRAIYIEQLGEELKQAGSKIILTGDGAALCYEKLKDTVPDLSVADENTRFVHASSIGFIAERKINNGENTVKSNELTPFYLRMPQAERELKNKKLKGEEK
ncbi:MAG: tRNA (adenosine(37)-N6)-threonylcarbamoyltransferase complex dimerization subunit type 1 TsaB [Oscillospiraceae bacterium]|nr:tRNA (adenosine(37)-N6)-threonylcarbamoyltransferase complex dimerization subunit type 1 TsaB [Oscillospiraceae bacterium]